MRIIKLGIMSLSMLGALLVSVPVFAISANSNSNAQAPNATPATNTNNQATERREAAKTKLADAKLKACQNRERNVNNIMSRISDRGQKQLELFTKIAERTEKFYTDKGVALANYDALVADAEAKRITAQNTVNIMKTSGTTFKCEGEDPRGSITAFKASLKNEIEALKAYKTSVKNLIVGVKSVQSTASVSPTTQGDQ